MREKLPDGASKRDHLTIVWKATGVKPPELDHEDPPASAMHVLAWFSEISVQERGHNGYSPLYLKSADIGAWFSLRCMRPRAWELDAIVQMDRAFMLHESERQDRERKIEESNDARNGATKKEAAT